MKSNDKGPLVVCTWAAVVVWVFVSTVLYVVPETHTETVLQQMVGVGQRRAMMVVGAPAGVQFMSARLTRAPISVWPLRRLSGNDEASFHYSVVQLLARVSRMATTGPSTRPGREGSLTTRQSPHCRAALRAVEPATFSEACRGNCL